VVALSICGSFITQLLNVTGNKLGNGSVKLI